MLLAKIVGLVNTQTLLIVGLFKTKQKSVLNYSQASGELREHMSVQIRFVKYLVALFRRTNINSFKILKAVFKRRMFSWLTNTVGVYLFSIKY